MNNAKRLALKTSLEKIKRIKNKVACFILFSGRKQFLKEAIQSVKKSDRKPDYFFVIQDASCSLHLSKNVVLIKTTPPFSGHWVYAFQKALKCVPKDAKYFFVMHDDDRIKSNYISSLLNHMDKNPFCCAVSCSLQSINLHGKNTCSKEFTFPYSIFADKENVLEHYTKSCIPFPAVFYRKTKKSIADYVDPSFGSFADGLFFAELAKHGTIEILPARLYEYRRHAGQMSILQSTKAEFRFLKELAMRSKTRKEHLLKLASQRATLATCNHIIQKRSLDSFFDQQKIGLPFDLTTVLKKPRLLMRFLINLCWTLKSVQKNNFSLVPKKEKPLEETLSIICFSKDRAMQLDGLLQSIIRQARATVSITVLYKTTTKSSFQAYQKIIKKYSNFKFVKEKIFEKQVIQIIKESNRFLCFVTDDSLFYEPFELENIIRNPKVFTFSLRLGLNCKYCYTSDRNMKLPNFITTEKSILWNWKTAKDDFGYPLSLDAHIFKKSVILKMAKKISFVGPNDFENNLANLIKQPELAKNLPEWMASYKTSRYVSIPVNRTQNKFLNRFGMTNRHSLISLNTKYIAGLQIDIPKTLIRQPCGAHEEYKLYFEKN